ncbi:hypothetical protein [Coleofasciculus sp. H7-2]|uniref:hypothetical protein n=1 Tax=Coleofasciculus sp. H7-2 TaxID=3351545 RepID=UPI0036730F03
MWNKSIQNSSDNGCQARSKGNSSDRSPHAIPIHYNEYTIFKSPLEDFMQVVIAAGLEQKVRYLSHGETDNFEVPITQ